MLIQFQIPGKDKIVACRMHSDCPILKGLPPTVRTCWNYVSLPNQFRPQGLQSMAAKEKERALQKATESYFKAMGVPGYEEG